MNPGSVLAQEEREVAGSTNSEEIDEHMVGVDHTEHEWHDEKVVKGKIQNSNWWHMITKFLNRHSYLLMLYPYIIYFLRLVVIIYCSNV